MLMERQEQMIGKHRRAPGRTERSLRVGVVGLGYWGPNLLRGLLERPGVDVSYVCDLDEERLSAIGRRYPAPGRQLALRICSAIQAWTRS